MFLLYAVIKDVYEHISPCQVFFPIVSSSNFISDSQRSAINICLTYHKSPKRNMKMHKEVNRHIEAKELMIIELSIHEDIKFDTD